MGPFSDDVDGPNIVEAHNLEDPLQALSQDDCANCTLKDEAGSITVQHFKAQSLSPTLFKWIMRLMEKNMKRIYKRSQGGWKERKKIKEMTSKTSRYLVAFKDSKPVAFSHFQFDMDYGREVLYCYEIQLETSVRRLGLGKHIMKTLEAIAGASKLPLVVLTVFKHNPDAIEFFRNLGYSIDETCPEDDEEKDYVIMSKQTSLQIL